MMNTRPRHDELSPQLLLRPNEASRSLAISPRLLWSLTNSGQIPCVRIGRAVRYDPRDLDAWISVQKSTAHAAQGCGNALTSGQRFALVDRQPATEASAA